jgi:hypothetical protein
MWIIFMRYAVILNISYSTKSVIITQPLNKK